MIQVVSRLTVRGRSPGEILDWLRGLDDERWRRMHPDHRAMREIRTVRDGAARLVHLDQVAGGLRICGTCRVTESREEGLLLLETLTFHPLGPLVRVTPARIRVHLTARGDDTEIVHDLRVGPSSPWLARLTDWILGHTILKPERRKEFDRHVVEEFTNLEKLIPPRASA